VVEGAAAADVPAGVGVVVRVVLPDRPGALGLVASRIGALGGDIVGIDVLERGERVAIDEFSLLLPRPDLTTLLIREIEEVDGASVEEWRAVETFGDPRLDALDTAERLLTQPDGDALAAQLVASTRREFDADWAALLRHDRVPIIDGGAPGEEWLQATAAGTAASPLVAEGVAGPDDLMVAPLTRAAAVLLVGRAGHAFRRRERRQLVALARIADHVAARLAKP
jgi:hypothetical protein